MKQELTIFDSQVLVFDGVDCDPYGQQSDFYRHLDRALNRSKDIPIEASGGIHQTFQDGLIDIPGFNGFFHKLYPTVLEAKKHYGITKPVLSFRRLWVNRIYYNCQSFTHNHHSHEQVPCDLIGIYYYCSQGEDSAKLIFTDINELGKFDHDIDSNQKHYLFTQTGRFIFHDPDIYHAVSKHHSQVPRTCFIFEFNFINETDINNTDITIV